MIDAARASVLLQGVDTVSAFEVFTEDVDSWWLRGPAFRVDARREGVLRFEPGVGGRLVEVFEGEASLAGTDLASDSDAVAVSQGIGEEWEHPTILPSSQCIWPATREGL